MKPLHGFPQRPGIPGIQRQRRFRQGSFPAETLLHMEQGPVFKQLLIAAGHRHHHVLFRKHCHILAEYAVELISGSPGQSPQLIAVPGIPLAHFAVNLLLRRRFHPAFGQYLQ